MATACEPGGSQAAPVAPGVDPNAPPTAEQLSAVWDVTLRDKDGKAVPFKDIVNASPRVMVIFIRHWFCPACQSYVKRLVATATPEALGSLPVKTSIAVIGSGGHQLIEHWREQANCPFPAYADKDLKLYKAFGLPRAMGAQQGSEYYNLNAWGGFKKAMAQVVYMPHKLHHAGDPNQNGGELLFEPATNGGAEKEVTFCHRMQHAADHSKFAETYEKLGLKNVPEAETAE